MLGFRVAVVPVRAAPKAGSAGANATAIARYTAAPRIHEELRIGMFM
jgi:hypothetical protein